MSRAPRILMYSHDTFGLGHLRRCRTIAESLVQHRPETSVLIVAGSPMVGSFRFPPQVDFVRVPGVVKLGADHYAPSNPGLSIEDLIALRGALIARTAEIFAPDVFLVDKEPLGLRGEVAAALRALRNTGTRLVLGLRDVMDEPARFAEEWQRKGALAAVEAYYHHVWIYGLPEICDPLDGLDLTPALRDRVSFTGYLERARTPSGAMADPVIGSEEPYVLVTTGGGGDGAMLVDWVLRAYEAAPDMPLRAKILLGPFMEAGQQTDFQERVSRLAKVDAVTFVSSIEPLIENAAGVVAMGGYNTFCEILSFNKRAIIVPRTHPRLEQQIRASRAEGLGLLRMLLPEKAGEADVMAEAIRSLPDQPRPATAAVPDLLGGLDRINALTDECIAEAGLRRTFMGPGASRRRSAALPDILRSRVPGE